ncbi:MAG: hypothetical protein WBG37_18960 [Desulfobacterales bacterium]
MTKIGLSTKDIKRLAQTLGATLQHIDSLEGFEIWLRRQPSVVSVKTADYLIKTEPPRKEVAVTFQMHDGSTATHVIIVILNPDQTFGFAGMRKP